EGSATAMTAAKRKTNRASMRKGKIRTLIAHHAAASDFAVTTRLRVSIAHPDRLAAPFHVRRIPLRPAPCRTPDHSTRSQNTAARSRLADPLRRALGRHGPKRLRQDVVVAQPHRLSDAQRRRNASAWRHLRRDGLAGNPPPCRFGFLIAARAHS